MVSPPPTATSGASRISRIRNVSWDDSVVEVDVTRETVRNAPAYDAAGAVDREWESRTHAHYRRPGYWTRRPELWRLWPPAA